MKKRLLKISIVLFFIYNRVFFAGLNKSYIYNTKNLVGEKIHIDLNDFIIMKKLMNKVSKF